MRTPLLYPPCRFRASCQCYMRKKSSGMTNRRDIPEVNPKSGFLRANVIKGKRVSMRSSIKKIIHKLGIEVKKTGGSDEKCITLKPKGTSLGNVLLSYTINPFLRKGGTDFDIRHTCDWECWKMAGIFLDMGYSVDVINYTNHEFKPKKDYSIFIDELLNLERISPLLPEDCIKIMHVVWAHWLFHNRAQYERCSELQKRRGISLLPRRLLEPNSGIEIADCATILGNEFTIGTYQYAKKPAYRIPVTIPRLYPWSEEKNFESCRKNYLWFGSGGLIHKGLDLVLDAFGEMPDYHLTICGPIQQEKDFESAFYKELYQTPNIHTIGWVNVDSSTFTEIVNNCIGIVYPSCSEGQSGAVVTCLSMGLIPIISYQSGIDVNGFGITLKECSVNQIKNSVQSISDLPTGELINMARSAWIYARENHARELFAKKYKDTITNIITTHRSRR